MYLAACDIPPDISKEELNCECRAFHDDFRGITPTITLHGMTFRLDAPIPWLTTPPAPAAAPAPRKAEDPLAITRDAPPLATAAAR